MKKRPPVLIVLLALGATYTYWKYAKYIVVLIGIFFVIKVVVSISGKLRRFKRKRRFQDIDTMNGLDFEDYIARLLVDLGCINVSLTEKYDYGVDIVAEKDGIRWGIQVKRYSGIVKAEAVRQVVTGLKLYSCDRAMVITNSSFSEVAKHLAKSNDCILIDRRKLDSLIRLKGENI